MVTPSIEELKKNFPSFGKIEWIGLRNSKDKAIIEVQFAELLAGRDLVGDKSGRRQGSKRQITLF